MSESPSKPGVIEAAAAYTLEEIQARLQLGKAAWRSARREGLPVRRVGRRGYVVGADLIAWLQKQPADEYATAA
jgi:hypothetical protein